MLYKKSENWSTTWGDGKVGGNETCDDGRDNCSNNRTCEKGVRFCNSDCMGYDAKMYDCQNKYYSSIKANHTHCKVICPASGTLLNKTCEQPTIYSIVNGNTTATNITSQSGNSSDRSTYAMETPSLGLQDQGS